MGELATHLLEAVARTDMFSTIIVASRDIQKGEEITEIYGEFTKTEIDL